MDNNLSKKKVGKIYCSKCDMIFENRKKYEKHIASHSSKVTCETCPLDMVIDKFVGFFKKLKSN